MSNDDVNKLYGYGSTTPGNWQPYIKLNLPEFQYEGYTIPAYTYETGTPFVIDQGYNRPVAKPLEQVLKEWETADYSGPFDPVRDSWYRVEERESWYQQFPGQKTRLQHVKDQLELINKIAANILKEIERIALEAGTSNTALLQQVGGYAVAAGSLFSATPVGIGLMIAGTLTTVIGKIVDSTKAQRLTARIQNLQYELIKLKEYQDRYTAELQQLQTKSNLVIVGLAVLALIKFAA